MKSIKQASWDSGISESLIRAVVRQIGGAESLEDVSRGGADAGFAGFTYYSDTVSFFKRHRAEIKLLVEDMAQDLGETPIEMVAAFGCLAGREMVRQVSSYSEDSRITRENKAKMAEYFPNISRCLYGGRMTSDDTTVANALAWFALEEVARAMCDE